MMDNKANILVTGSTGFVGLGLLDKLNLNHVVCIGRTPPKNKNIKFFNKDLSKTNNYSDCLESIAVIIHSAGRAHILNEFAEDPLQAYREVNTNGTIKLAKAAAKAGVKRFIFISTLKVNGEETDHKNPFKYNDIPNPQDEYSISKYEAELALIDVCKNSDMDYVILRPPLIYGKGVKANFASLISLCKRKIYLPFGKVNNKRSFLSLENFCNLICLCVEHEGAKNQIFLISDNSNISTSELIKIIRKLNGLKSMLINIPIGVLKFISIILFKRDLFMRLCGNLEADITHTMDKLDWKPNSSMEDNLRNII